MERALRVIRSINEPGGPRCVDIFERADGTFGFEEFRREPEDLRGWFKVGEFGAARFVGLDEALATARSRVGWLADALG